ncbi:rRNA pseudouridine synthase [Candidatus Woesearchaeota archaeon]|nr:rRNA pseudouridine synthase [Candidatus Woesearchaeota archaeon]MBW2993919.1 rRNA pseudouridine synthase [Candidatus Woesearchaeota archaeon]
MEERVQKIMAASGVASRRKCEELIEQGRVKINGKKAKLGDKADAIQDFITLDGQILQMQRKVYYAFNKPKGYVTSLKQKGKKTIMDLLKFEEKVFPVGRLDENTEGLLLLTNDGELANRIMHPRYKTYKTYYVVLDRQFKHAGLLNRITLDGKPLKIKKYLLQTEGLQITIHEGQKHVVKRIFAKLGYKVQELKRLQVANIKLGNLRTGKVRPLRRKELKELRTLLKMS